MGPLTFLLLGVQLGDANGEAVHALLQGVDPEGEGVGLVEQLPKQVLRILTYTHTHTHTQDTLIKHVCQPPPSQPVLCVRLTERFRREITSCVRTSSFFFGCFF